MNSLTTENYVGRKTIDVSNLPATLLDTSEPLWWGNIWGLVIETMAFGILAAIYFSVRSNLSPFPPPQIDSFPVNYNPVPDLLVPTINLVVLLASLVPGIWLDLSARKKNESAVKILLPVTLIFNVVAIVLRFYEFNSLYFRWDDNAYGSITWTILGMHLLHLFVLGSEDLYLLIWVYIRGLDDKNALDLTVLAVYWYWVVGMWVLFYVLVYLSPRF